MNREHNVPETIYYRFSVLDRILHFVVMIGFIVLGVTGMSLAFSAHGWAKAVMWFLGGQSGAAWLHRVFAIATYLCVLIHGMYFIYLKAVLKRNWTGPQSVVPNKKDLRDFYDNILYFIGKKEAPPKFDRFNYMEKVDYWAVFIGMNTMGLTGLILWFPEAFTRVLPGFFVNLAQILHFYEAFLAVIVKFFIHAAMAHLRPEVYPADKSIFSGKTTEHRIKTEHPGEWEYMQKKETEV